MKRIILALISFYRKRISPSKGTPCCRYTPTCSRYAYTAVNEWGAIAGLTLATLRILRCQPLFKGGHDPVPRRKRKIIPATEPFGRDSVKKDGLPTYPYLISYGSYIE